MGLKVHFKVQKVVNYLTDIFFFLKRLKILYVTDICFYASAKIKYIITEK